jgi:hypothetical protein
MKIKLIISDDDGSNEVNSEIEAELNVDCIDECPQQIWVDELVCVFNQQLQLNFEKTFPVFIEKMIENGK